MSGPFLKPCTFTLVPQLLPASSGTIEALTLVTPGSADSSSSIRSKIAFDFSDGYPFSSGDTENVTRVSSFTPRSTRLTLNRLLVKRPADASRAIESAICTVTSPMRKRAAARAPEGWPAVPLRVLARSGRVL